MKRTCTVYFEDHGMGHEEVVKFYDASVIGISECIRQTLTGIEKHFPSATVKSIFFYTEE